MMTSRQARILEDWVELARIAPKQGLVALDGGAVHITDKLFLEMFGGGEVEVIGFSKIADKKHAFCRVSFDGMAVVAMVPEDELWAV